MRARIAGTAVFLAASIGSTAAFAIEGGAEDRTTTHAVAISRGSPSAPAVRCTGTLISINVVLTARHCILEETPSVNGGCEADLGAIDERNVRDTWISASPYAEPNRGWHRVAKAIVPETTKVCGDDIALLVLDDPITPAEATPARPITGAAERDEAIRAGILGIAGFGATSVEATDIGLRRARFDVPFQCVPGSVDWPCGAASAYVGSREFSAGAGPCRGDSGAGALVVKDRQVIFGVLARGNLARSCAEGIFVRTDAWAWLIARAVVDASAESAPAWARDLFPPAPRRGQFCRGTDACADGGACVSLDERRSFMCFDHCKSGGCADGYVCDRDICIPPTNAAAPEDDGGCHIGTRSHADEALVVAGLLFAFFAARRRPL